ncbi:hypothetical protein BT69DRAFT_1288058 [Atractiella rhizophila]|nr:hypothetical protein BT69DRAFT_1288058 [Atractiella rhizophila]
MSSAPAGPKFSLPPPTDSTLLIAGGAVAFLLTAAYNPSGYLVAFRQAVETKTNNPNIFPLIIKILGIAHVLETGLMWKKCSSSRVTGAERLKWTVAALFGGVVFLNRFDKLNKPKKA